MQGDINTPQELKEKIQQLMIDVTGDSYQDIRTASEDFTYNDKQGGCDVHLLVETNGSEINVSVDEFVSTIERFLEPNAENKHTTNHEESVEIVRFRRYNEPYKKNIMYEYEGKKMYCAVSMSIKTPGYR